MLDKVTNPFINLNGCTVDFVGMDKYFYPTSDYGCNGNENGSLFLVVIIYFIIDRDANETN